MSLEEKIDQAKGAIKQEIGKIVTLHTNIPLLYIGVVWIVKPPQYYFCYTYSYN